MDRLLNGHPQAKRVELLDPAVLLAACGGDADILDKICKAFGTRLPEQVKAVQDALRERNIPGLREAAHKLCGMVSAFSRVAGEAASKLEDLAAEQRVEEARPLVQTLEQMGRQLVQEVDGLSLDTLKSRVRAHNENQAARS
jgi:HPt (histidine-containing phosphotransfer) domain-containing protein